MTYFSKNDFSSCEIAGAVASAALRDLRVNFFAFNGFPQIQVADPKDDVFKVTLSWQPANKKDEISFDLTRSEAIAAATSFKNNKDVDRNIFDRIQAAVASLEGAIRKNS